MLIPGKIEGRVALKLVDYDGMGAGGGALRPREAELFEGDAQPRDGARDRSLRDGLDASDLLLLVAVGEHGTPP